MKISSGEVKRETMRHNEKAIIRLWLTNKTNLYLVGLISLIVLYKPVYWLMLTAWCYVYGLIY